LSSSIISGTSNGRSMSIMDDVVDDVLICVVS